MFNVIKVILLIFPLFVSAQRFGSSITPGSEMETESDVAREPQKPFDLVALDGPVDPEKYLVGPGDQFLVSIQTAETLEKVVLISPAGFLVLPGAGKVDLRGLTLSEATQRMEQTIHQNIKNARVAVELVGIRNIKVAIVGAVQEPGYYSLTPVSRLTDIIELAKVRPLALLIKVEVVNRTGEKAYYDLSSFYKTGDISQNPFLVEGDRVVVGYANLGTQTIVVRGAVMEAGYDLLKPNETLAELIARRIDFKPSADLENVKIVRKINGKDEIITVPPVQFNDFTLQAGDNIEYLYEKPINVQGRVASPGSFVFVPGYTAGDYVAMAGGLLPSGTMKKIKITRLDGSTLTGEDVLIARGDIIEVPRSVMNVVLGEISVLELVSSITTVVLAIMAVK